MSGDGLDGDDDDDDDSSDFDIDETDLESYSTVLEANEDIDEFQIFCDSLQSRSFTTNIFYYLSRFIELQSDITGYNQALLQSLSPEQRTSIQTIIHYTEKRKQEKGKFRCFYSLICKCCLENFKNQIKFVKPVVITLHNQLLLDNQQISTLQEMVQ
jgi:hypothetical protein